jgi:hypothetical protein
MAMTTGSAEESLRVRLLSIPQGKARAGDEQRAEIQDDSAAVP